MRQTQLIPKRPLAQSIDRRPRRDLAHARRNRRPVCDNGGQPVAHGIRQAQSPRDPHHRPLIRRQQGRQPQDRIIAQPAQGLEHRQRLHVRQRLRQDPAVLHRPDGRARIRRGQQLQQLLGHPLGGQLAHAALQRPAGRQPDRIRRAPPVPGVKPEKPQDPQIVFANACLGLADEDDPPRRRVLQPAAGRVEHRPIGVGV